MLKYFIEFIRSLFISPLVRLVIVRRYTDANGAYVGELYMYKAYGHGGAYEMIGMSLDTLPLKWQDSCEWMPFILDTRQDFLALMPLHTIRIGALDPKDNDRVRRMISKLPRKNMMLVVQNRFIEYVLEPKKI